MRCRSYRHPLAAVAIAITMLLAGAELARADSDGALADAVKIASEVAGHGFAAPPGSIGDVTAILDQQKPDPTLAQALRAAADAKSHEDLKGIQLARFYVERGAVAGDIGREAQRLADYRLAYSLVEPRKDKALGDYAQDANLLATAEARAGNPQVALQLREQKVEFFESLLRDDGAGEPKNNKRNAHQGTLFVEYHNLVGAYLDRGRFQDAQVVLSKADALLAQSRR
jgi:tetratricopeptide (TPR) repeat protein